MAGGRGLWHHRGMPKRVSRKDRPQDVNQLAHRLVELSIGERLTDKPQEQSIGAPLKQDNPIQPAKHKPSSAKSAKKPSKR